MKTSYGFRGMLIKEIGLTWNQIHYEIPYNTLQKMLIDIPQVTYDEDDKESAANPYADLQEENLEDYVAKLNSIYD